MPPATGEAMKISGAFCWFREMIVYELARRKECNLIGVAKEIGNIVCNLDARVKVQGSPQVRAVQTRNVFGVDTIVPERSLEIPLLLDEGERTSKVLSGLSECETWTLVVLPDSAIV